MFQVLFLVVAILNLVAGHCNVTEVATIYAGLNATITCLEGNPSSDCVSGVTSHCASCFNGTIGACVRAGECTDATCAQTSCDFEQECIEGGIPTVSPTTQGNIVLTSYSLIGVWDRYRDISTPGFRYCQSQLNATQTAITFSYLCYPASGDTVVVSELSIPSLGVSACGQNQQLGMTWGVFGGPTTGTTGNGTLCVSYTRVDASHIGNGQKNALVNFVSWVPKPNPTCTGAFCCTQAKPVDSSIEPPNDATALTTGEFNCVKGVCDSNKRSSICSSFSPLSDIGIGMSVGGIGLLLVTLVLILVISSVVQG